MRTFERVSGFLSHGQTQARSAVPRSSSSAPTPAAKQQIFAIHFYTQISLTLKMPKNVTHHSILWQAAWCTHYSQLVFSAASDVVSPPDQRRRRGEAPSASVSPSIFAPAHTAALAFFWAADP